MRSRQQRNLVFVGSFIVLAVLAAIAVIWMSSSGGTSDSIDYGAIPQSRTEDGGFVLGSEDAPVTIVEFADFICSHCQEYQEVVHRIIRDFVATGKARFEYRLYPIVHPQLSPYSAGLAECADQLAPGAFWPAHDLLYILASKGGYDTMASVAATQLHLNYSDLVACTGSAHQYETDYQLGQQAGVSGTPAVRVRYADGQLTSITVNGQSYDRGGPPYSVIAQVINAANS